MKKITFQNISSIFAFILGAAIFGIQFALSFTEPSSSPPQNNVPAPLNISAVGQIKSGNLTVNGLGISGTGNALLVTGGNVGIGTTGPGKRLDVQTTTNTDGIRVTGNAANAGLIVKNTGIGGNSWAFSSTGAGHSLGNGKLILFSNENFATGNARVTVDGGGRVGIGTTNPDAASKLEVAGQVKITGGIPGAGKVLTSNLTGLASWEALPAQLPTGTDGQTLRNNGTGWIANSVLLNNGTEVGVGALVTGVRTNINGGVDSLLRLTRTGGTDPTTFKLGIDDVLVINNDGLDTLALKGGRVGIGTTNPDAASKLEVAGQVKITGGIPGAGKVLTSNLTGLASWEAPSSGGPAGGDLTGTYPNPGIAADAVALTTDTTGNYVAGLTAGTGISISGTAGEGWSPTVSVASGGITTALLADTAVTTAKISDTAVTTAKLTDGSVTSAKIADGTIVFTDWNQNGCANDQIPKWNGVVWACAGDATSGGGASGDLTGTYPSPLIAPNTVTSAKIVDGTIVFADWASNSCTNGQIPKYNGTAWTCQADDNTSISYSAGTNLSLSGTTFSVVNNPSFSSTVGIGGTNSTAQLYINNTLGNDNMLLLSHPGAAGTMFRLGADGVLVINNNASDILTLNGTAGVVTIAGQIKITGGSSGTGKLLFSDASGLANWGAPGGDLTGTYPSPTIASGAVTDGKIASGISGSKIVPNFGSQTITTTADVRLGTSGTLYAPGGQENLRIIRGTVSGAGSVLGGTGFTINKFGTGVYSVQFSTSFTATPSVTATAQGGGGGQPNVNACVAEIRTKSAGSAEINIVCTTSTGQAWNINPTDREFDFIAVGPR